MKALKQYKKDRLRKLIRQGDVTLIEAKELWKTYLRLYKEVMQ